MIFKKNQSLYATEKMASVAIDKNDLNHALRLIHDFVERIITEPLCTGVVNGSKVLDELCQKIGNRNFLAMTKSTHEPSVMKTSEHVFVYIVTKLQKSGGHSRIVERFITARPNAKHILLSTELNGQSDCAMMLNSFVNLTDVAFEPAPSGNLHQKLRWLQQRLIEIRPQHAYLFNDHQDSVAVAAIQPAMALNASFYHHGDHHLSLGLFLPHLTHIDIHPMGYHHCRGSLDINNIYLPLTTDDKGMRATNIPFKQNGYLTTCTAARANKIEKPYFINYLDLIPQLLKATGGKHIHIGQLTPWALFYLRRGLKKQGITSKQFTYIPWVPSVWKAIQELGVDLYIASFPYGGGLTLTEAMGAGVPVALHRHIYSRVLSGIDLAYPDAFSWKKPEELMDFCSTVNADELQKHSIMGRKHYETFYHQNIFNALVNKQMESPIPGPLSKYQEEKDAWACWMESQLTLAKLILRRAYRLYRRLRRR